MNNEDGQKGNSYEMLKCIWMSSQVVEYKLCDKQFDCENCSFDQVIRNFSHEKEPQVPPTTDITKIILKKLRHIKYDDKIIYLKNNLIAKEIFQNTFYLGINPILFCFLDTISTIMECERGKNIFTGQQVIQFSGDWGSISLSAPMNFSIFDKVSDTLDDPTNTKWFAIIGSFQQDISIGKLDQEEWSKMYQRALGIVEDIQLDYPIIGDTMQDGGNRINFLYQLVGKKRYIQILNSLSE